MADLESHTTVRWAISAARGGAALAGRPIEHLQRIDAAAADYEAGYAAGDVERQRAALRQLADLVPLFRGALHAWESKQIASDVRGMFGGPRR